MYNNRLTIVSLLLYMFCYGCNLMIDVTYYIKIFVPPSI